MTRTTVFGLCDAPSKPVTSYLYFVPSLIRWSALLGQGKSKFRLAIYSIRYKDRLLPDAR
jgi:hypothetical protein